METNKMILEKAEHNRYGCTICGRNISKGTKYYRSSMQKWRASHTVNICERCLARMAVELNYDDKKLSEIRKEIIVEELTKQNGI